MHIFPLDSELPVRHLAACFNNTSATYKFYWLLGILDLVAEGNKEMDKKEIFVRMISNGWYTVNYFHVSFGQQDLIQDTVKALQITENISIDSPQSSIISKLLASDNKLTRKLIFHFDKNVPHWFLSPWYPKMDKNDIYLSSQKQAGQPLYSLYKEHIVVTDDWFAYLQRNIRLIRDFVYWNLSLFLQVRNPNVPDIPGKLIKPAVRNSLVRQRRFWDYVMEVNGPIRCIYTGKELYKGNYHVEHFIPYSFVSHDQIWNLIPADNTFNVAKNNKLPQLEQYFSPFYEMQRLALGTYLKERPNEKLLQDYFYNGTDLKNGLSKDMFYDVISPLVTIAANNGFEFLRKIEV